MISPAADSIIEPMAVVVCAVLAYLLGAMPFSLWLGRLTAGRDIRSVGDGNPGAINAWKTGGWKVGLPALLLDYLKGALPVGLAHFQYGLSGWGLVPVALAPVLGHASTPLLKFQGGKAVAASFGVWTGLMLWEGPTVLGACLGFFFLLQDVDAWAVALGKVAFGSYLALSGAAPYLLAVWAGNLAVLIWKSYRDLRHPLHLRGWVSGAFRRAG